MTTGYFNYRQYGCVLVKAQAVYMLLWWGKALDRGDLEARCRGTPLGQREAGGLSTVTHIAHVESDLQVAGEGLVELRVQVQHVQQIVAVDLVQIAVCEGAHIA
jgi:hypothetical protein